MEGFSRNREELGPARALRSGDDRKRTYTHTFLGAAIPLEFHIAVNGGKEGVVATTADIRSRIDTSAALTHDDGAGSHEFAVEAFYTEHFRLAVATIARAAYTFFMCHLELILKLAHPARMMRAAHSQGDTAHQPGFGSRKLLIPLGFFPILFVEFAE